MKKWKYMTCENLFESELDEYGANGWELVSVVSDGNDDLVFYFKREIKK
jgi:hypothetical protein